MRADRGSRCSLRPATAGVMAQIQTIGGEQMWIVSLLLVVIAASCSLADAEPMSIACASLSPGASAESVRNLILGCGSSTELREDTANSWRIGQRTPNGWKPIGQLEFKNGRLLRLTRTCSNVRDKSAHAVTSTLLSLLSSLAGESKATGVLVSVSTLRNPGGDVNILQLYIGKRLVTVYVSQPEGAGPAVQIDETAD